jgi:hypothetical protein
MGTNQVPEKGGTTYGNGCISQKADQGKPDGEPEAEAKAQRGPPSVRQADSLLWDAPAESGLETQTPSSSRAPSQAQRRTKARQEARQTGDKSGPGPHTGCRQSKEENEDGSNEKETPEGVFKPAPEE